MKFLNKFMSIFVPRPASVIRVEERESGDGTRVTTRTKVHASGRQTTKEQISFVPPKKATPTAPRIAPGETQVIETVYPDGSKLVRTVVANPDGSHTVTEIHTPASEVPIAVATAPMEVPESIPIVAAEGVKAVPY